ncbi:hypothetical protein [Accumulibacter sp.]|uniref:hypothetical protein n=1 Tax=Accumulibacter sp. TaxID=2053492 RepID=UPI002606F704|nr:hypothetical protein [Accumulibacter sp.]
MLDGISVGFEGLVASASSGCPCLDSDRLVTPGRRWLSAGWQGVRTCATAGSLAKAPDRPVGQHSLCAQMGIIVLVRRAAVHVRPPAANKRPELGAAGRSADVLPPIATKAEDNGQILSGFGWWRVYWGDVRDSNP